MAVIKWSCKPWHFSKLFSITIFPLRQFEIFIFFGITNSGVTKTYLWLLSSSGSGSFCGSMRLKDLRKPSIIEAFSGSAKILFNSLHSSKFYFLQEWILLPAKAALANKATTTLAAKNFIILRHCYWDCVFVVERRVKWWIKRNQTKIKQQQLVFQVNYPQLINLEPDCNKQISPTLF